ncbi:hypothetical protein [Gluconobacter cerinus]|uniref:hypothetical protein n=1 Tax=Gluconobacter cerinus TaxID=38307 RepID=UPI001B8C9A61|nr:hypothetical protein [Gluconobacter cerinus]MBS1033982.1 hypothetical protein [Gluconobacter cerinus]
MVVQLRLSCHHHAQCLGDDRIFWRGLEESLKNALTSNGKYIPLSPPDRTVGVFSVEDHEICNVKKGNISFKSDINNEESDCSCIEGVERE